MDVYDFIIAGAGAAGLTLAHHLSHSALADRSILLVDKDDDDQLSRNYGYWSRRTTLYEEAPHHAWRWLEIVSDGAAQRIPLDPYAYRLVRGAEFYLSTLDELKALPNVTRARGVIDSIEEGADGARVVIDDRAYHGRWVFDSLVSQADVRRMSNGGAPLKMHFKGWEIETAEPVFDKTTATMFDFRCEQRGQVRFFYVMPFTRQFALVEFVVYSPNVLPQAEYDAALREHIEVTRSIRGYRVVDEETGCLPLTNTSLPRRPSAHVMRLGTKAGRLKPSTGYSVMRADKDARAIVRSLIERGHPFDVPADSRWYRWLDEVMLDVMRNDGGRIKPVFQRMFARNPIGRVFRFLDEEASVADNALLILSLPKTPFAAAALRLFARAARPRRAGGTGT